MSGRSQIYGTAIETDNLTAETQADTRTGNPLGRIEWHKYLLPAGFTDRLPVIGNIDDSTLPLSIEAVMSMSEAPAWTAFLIRLFIT